MKYNYVRLQPIQPIRADVLQQTTPNPLAGISHKNNLPGFELYLLKGGRKPRTVQLHIDMLSRLLAAVSDLSIASIEGYFSELKKSGRKGTYINDYINALRHYGRFLQTDYFNSLSYFKEEEHIKATLSDEEVEAFLKLRPPATTRNDPRSGKTLTYRFDEKSWNVWTLFFKILAYSGMRCGEVAHLTVDTVDFGRQVFILEDTKTNTPRFVPIAPAVLDELAEHIKTLNGEYLFPSKQGRLSKRQNASVVDDVDWGYQFHKRLNLLGIKRKNLTPYSLRHSFITRMLDQDVSLPKVQKIVGHRRIDTTMHYTHLTTKDIIKAIKKDPLGRKYLSTYEVLKNVSATLNALVDTEDNRFEYSLEEKDDGILFSLKIRKEL